MSIPMDETSLHPWTSGGDRQIYYYLDLPTESYKESFREAFREWSVGISSWTDHIRLVEVDNADAAHIQVKSSSTPTRAGCLVDEFQAKFCDLNWQPGSGNVSYWVGRLLGVPTSSNPGDVMSPNSNNPFFTQSDFDNMTTAYGRPIQGDYMPIFDAKYANQTGYETIIGWESMRSRIQPNPVYVQVNSRKVVGAVINRIPEAGYYATYEIQGYTWFAGGLDKSAHWPFQPKTFTSLIIGNDVPRGRLGDGGCPNDNYSLVEAFSSAPTATKGYRLFGYETDSMSMRWDGKKFSPTIVNHAHGKNVRVFFYFDNLNKSWRVTTDTTYVKQFPCRRLGGFGLAFN